MVVGDSSARESYALIVRRISKSRSEYGVDLCDSSNTGLGGETVADDSERGELSTMDMVTAGKNTCGSATPQTWGNWESFCITYD